MANKRKKAERVFEEYEMITGWTPDHKEAVFAGKMPLEKAIKENVEVFCVWSKKASVDLKTLLRALEA